MRHAQNGAALAVGLLLLAVLTVLATSTMSTAALELSMSGGDQYHARAFRAAEIGIARALVNGSFNPSSETILTESLDEGDYYTMTIRPCGETTAPAGFNNTFTAEHYEIESIGHSHRNARVALIQGLFVVRPPAASASTQTGPPLCLSGMEILPSVCAKEGTPIPTYWRPAK